MHQNVSFTVENIKKNQGIEQSLGDFSASILARSALDQHVPCSAHILCHYATVLTVHSQLVFQQIQRYLHCALSLAA